MPSVLSVNAVDVGLIVKLPDVAFAIFSVPWKLISVPSVHSSAGSFNPTVGNSNTSTVEDDVFEHPFPSLTVKVTV